MKTIKMDELPKCDICKEKDARYDAPTKRGSWAYMCESCFKKNRAIGSLGTMGNKLVKRGPKMKEKRGVLRGIEDTSIEQLEAVLMGREDRQIECPNCNEVRTVEPDAEYTFECEGCDSKVKVPTPII